MSIDKKLTNSQASQFTSAPEESEIREALKKASNSISPGLDGIPAEVWKDLSDRHKKDVDLNLADAFDVIELLKLIYKDIFENGICKSAKFSEGLMTPLYNKNKRTKIENYRPITLLNTDYKLYTKIFADRLSGVATDIIHPSQAGFIPGRQISDQTQVVCLLKSYCKETGTSRLITFLDQEKAYDKIMHDYLLRVLQKYNFPEECVNTIKEIYEAAEMSVLS